MENKYSEIIKEYTNEQLIKERAILDKQLINIHIKDKELKEEFKRRLEEGESKC
nr:MAG TPA: hypothetical protein [Caudoviricetes sp.]